MSKYTVQFKHGISGAKVVNIEADSAEQALKIGGKDLGLVIDRTDPFFDQSHLIEAILQTPAFELNMTDSYNFNITLHPWGADHGVVEIDTAALYGYWERKDGSEGGGLWFCRELIGSRLDQKGPLELMDFDGACELPRSVVAALRAAGVVLDETFDA